MEINASSVYDKKTIVAYTKQSIKRFKPLYIILYILFGFMFIVDLYDIIALDASISVLIAPVFICAFFLLFIYVFLPKLNYKMQKTTTDTINKYTFYDTKLVAISTAKGITSTSEVEYSTLDRVLENKKYIYIYIAKDKAMIVDKSTITNGSIDEIRCAITSQIGTNKYKIKV